jgi:hypothetical protein
MVAKDLANPDPLSAGVQFAHFVATLMLPTSKGRNSTTTSLVILLLIRKVMFKSLSNTAFPQPGRKEGPSTKSKCCTAKKRTPSLSTRRTVRQPET